MVAPPPWGNRRGLRSIVRTERLPALDALRGAAALVVLSYHVASVYGLGGQPNGYLAVDFFFMLSGFVIARVLERGSRTPTQFLKWRYTRFWPTMAVGTALGLCFVPGTYSQALPGLLLIPILVGKYIFPFNPPAWSIFFELCANAVHSVLRRFWPAVFAVSLFWLMVTGGFGGGPNPDNVMRGLPRVLMAYSIGVMMFQRWGDHPPLKLSPYWGLLLLAVLLPVRSLWFDYAFVLLICPLVIMNGTRGSLPFATELGTLSFPLYAVHYPLLLAAKSAGANAISAGALAIAVAAAMSAISAPIVRSSRDDALAPAP